MNQINKTAGDVASNNIDSVTLCPSLVSTPMTNFVKGGIKACTPDHTARGTLKNLGTIDMQFGSDLHALWGF